jgi:hypothetical protein
VTRPLSRWLLLGGGPLRRATDRVEALSRLVVLGTLLAAVPLGMAVDRTVSTALHQTADAEASGRDQRTATLLADAPVGTSPEDTEVLVEAQWLSPSGGSETGQVLAPSGATVGSTVTVWVDTRGLITMAPQSSGDVTAQSVLSGVLAGLVLPLLALLAHLLVVHLLDRARLRRWTAEWASVEPLWAGRTR